MGFNHIHNILFAIRERCLSGTMAILPFSITEVRELNTYLVHIEKWGNWQANSTFFTCLKKHVEKTAKVHPRSRAAQELVQKLAAIEKQLL